MEALEAHATHGDGENLRGEVATQGAVRPPARGEERGGYGRKEPPSCPEPRPPT